MAVDLYALAVQVDDRNLVRQSGHRGLTVEALVSLRIVGAVAARLVENCAFQADGAIHVLVFRERRFVGGIRALRGEREAVEWPEDVHVAVRGAGGQGRTWRAVGT